MEFPNNAANTTVLITALESPGRDHTHVQGGAAADPAASSEPGEMVSVRAIHLSQSDASFRARLDLILSTPEPFIKTIENSPEDEAGAMLDVDLDESLDRYVRERASLVERLKKLSPDEWQKTAEHEAFDHYSVFIMFRHLFNHEMLHAYRIEELLLRKDWD